MDLFCFRLRGVDSPTFIFHFLNMFQQNIFNVVRHGSVLTGKANDNRGGTAITIHDGAVITNPYSAGLYIPQDGTVIVLGGTITGKSSGIALKSGALNISGGIIRATGEYKAPTEGQSNGVNASGAAIQLESNSDYIGNIAVGITGGSFISEKGYSLYEYLGKGEETQVKSISVSNGEFIGAINTSQALAAVKKLTISGGQFTYDPATMLRPGILPRPSATTLATLKLA